MTRRPPLRITIAQLNPTVGDIAGNTEKILSVWDTHKNTSDLIVFSELVLSGYQPEDLVLHDHFMADLRNAAHHITKQTKNGAATLAVSTPWINDNGERQNTVLIMRAGQIIQTVAKHHLPNYGVFDEIRVFKPGPLPEPVEVKGHKIGIATCEDLWFPDTAAHLKSNGAEILISLNGSPFETAKDEKRKSIVTARVQETALPSIYINQVGGQDEIVFDGGSFAMDAHGNIVMHMPFFTEHTKTIEFPFNNSTPVIKQNITMCRLEKIYGALCLGIKDYVDKNNFAGVLIGLSGGIDSALTAALAVDALGKDRVHCVMMPSIHTSDESLNDAASLVQNLGCRYDILSIDDIVKTYSDTLDNPQGVTAENIQSRARGIMLMAMSNRDGYMVLTTGNKSEMAVGYATLYGDMCGGFNALKDIYKTTVYELSNWRNGVAPIIPGNIITRAPSAELRPDQRDDDSLPPYDILDQILQGMIEERLSISDLVEHGFDRETVIRVRLLLDRSEYKRRQAPPGVKISNHAFGRERRMPITNGYKETLSA